MSKRNKMVSCQRCHSSMRSDKLKRHEAACRAGKARITKQQRHNLNSTVISSKHCKKANSICTKATINEHRKAVCSTCDQLFCRNRLMNHQQRCSSRMKPTNERVCQYCGQEFARKQNLAGHIRRYHTVSFFECEAATRSLLRVLKGISTSHCAGPSGKRGCAATVASSSAWKPRSNAIESASAAPASSAA